MLFPKSLPNSNSCQHDSNDPKRQDRDQASDQDEDQDQVQDQHQGQNQLPSSTKLKDQ